MQKENQQRNPVLLVHGIWDTGKVFRRMTAYLKEGGWEVYDLDLNPNDGSRVQGVTIEVKNSHSKEYMQQQMLNNCLKNDNKMKNSSYQRRRNRKAVSPSLPLTG